MKFSCEFCAEFFSDFSTYKNHLKKQHKKDTLINVEVKKLDKSEIKCTENCNWLERYKKHVLYNIDGSRYCKECKIECIPKLRIKKAYKAYFDRIRHLDHIIHPELWVEIDQNWYSCCWCYEYNHGDEDGTEKTFQFVGHERHRFCESCFEYVQDSRYNYIFKEQDQYHRCQCKYAKILRKFELEYDSDDSDECGKTMKDYEYDSDDSDL